MRSRWPCATPRAAPRSDALRRCVDEMGAGDGGFSAPGRGAGQALLLKILSGERAAKYDKLGVNKALLQLQMSFDRKRLVAPQQLLPMLDRIAKNDTYIHMARERAAGMADAIRANR